MKNVSNIIGVTALKLKTAQMNIQTKFVLTQTALKENVTLDNLIPVSLAKDVFSILRRYAFIPILLLLANDEDSP